MGEARTLPFSQHPLFWRYTHYQRALLSERSRVKCPLPDIKLVGTAKKAQRRHMSDSLRKAPMGNFVTRENIERYRRLAAESMDSGERGKITRTMTRRRANSERVENDGERQRGGS